MDIDITSLSNVAARFYSSSVAKSGPNAAQDTWRAAMEQTDSLLKTPEEVKAMREWLLNSGGWEKKEIKKFSGQELNALFLQLVCSEIQEAGAARLIDIDFDAYELDENAGNLFKLGDTYYFYLGN